MGYVVGGNTNEIYDAIRAAVLLGGHGLGPQLTDDELLNIAAAMKAAFKDYAAEIEKEDLSFDGECSAECVDGVLNEAACVCEECVNNCCAFMISDANKNGPNIFLIFIFVFFVALRF